MSYRVIVKPEAELDIAEATQYLEEMQIGLGGRFIDVLDDAIQKIQSNPLLYEVKYKNIRIKYIHPFRYGIHFLVEQQTIYLLAVMHTSRKPKT